MKTLVASLVLISLGVMSSPAPAQVVYSWVDAKGVRHYEDRPLGGAKMQQRTYTATVARTETVDAAGTDKKAAEAPKEAPSKDEAKRIEKLENCQIAQNNLKLLDTPGTQVVEKSDSSSSKPLDAASREEARGLALRQVQEFCR